MEFKNFVSILSLPKIKSFVEQINLADEGGQVKEALLWLFVIVFFLVGFLQQLSSSQVLWTAASLRKKVISLIW